MNAKQVIVTGGAGFIGSCLIRKLNDVGIHEIVVVDDIGLTDKWKNLCGKNYLEYIHKNDFLAQLSYFSGKVSHIIHMGACSATTEKNFDYLYQNNLKFTTALWQFCADQGISFIYASSAATYGDGACGFDDRTDIKKLRPLNGYGYSKQLFDLWAERQTLRPAQCVGLKFFNVYGPNEYYKGDMASVILHGYRSIKRDGEIHLFKSYRDDFEDGGQLRDFIYVKDICFVVQYMMEHPEISGLFNLGTGHARSFRDLGQAVFAALGLPENITYIEMPDHLRMKYQYFTQASIEKLRQAGYVAPFFSLEEGIMDYVCNYLEKDYATY